MMAEEAALTARVTLLSYYGARPRVIQALIGNAVHPLELENAWKRVGDPLRVGSPGPLPTIWSIQKLKREDRLELISLLEDYLELVIQGVSELDAVLASWRVRLGRMNSANAAPRTDSPELGESKAAAPDDLQGSLQISKFILAIAFLKASRIVIKYCAGCGEPLLHIEGSKQIRIRCLYCNRVNEPSEGVIPESLQRAIRSNLVTSRR